MEILCTSLGKQCIINVSDRTDKNIIIRGEKYNRNYPVYCLRWYSNANTRVRPESGFKWKNNSIYWKIKSIEQIPYFDNVYCIECKNPEEPYFTLPSGLITHNCRLQNAVQDNTFSFTNGMVGVMTGSKQVITLNLNRIVQDWNKSAMSLKRHLITILDRVYKYHTAYNKMLHWANDNNLFNAYKARFIDLDKQYLTIGIAGLNQAAEYLGIKCNNNKEYQDFCSLIFNTIKEQNTLHKTKTENFNTELVPKFCGHSKPLLIDLELLIGQQGASKNYFCAA
jgi:hypothetical protein